VRACVIAYACFLITTRNQHRVGAVRRIDATVITRVYLSRRAAERSARAAYPLVTIAIAKQHVLQFRKSRTEGGKGRVITEASPPRRQTRIRTRTPYAVRKLSNLLMIFSRGSYFSLSVRRLLMSVLRQMILRPRRVQGPLRDPPVSPTFLTIAMHRSGSQRADDCGKRLGPRGSSDRTIDFRFERCSMDRRFECRILGDFILCTRRQSIGRFVLRRRAARIY